MCNFKVMGLADSGKCDHCGANCPKQRMYVVPVDADGCHGEAECWGVICASKARGEKGTATDLKYLSRFARAVDGFRAVIAAGGGEAEIRKANRHNFPWEIRGGVLKVWSGHGTGSPAAEIAVAASV